MDRACVLNKKVGGLKEFWLLSGQAFPLIPLFVVRMMLSIHGNKAYFSAQGSVLILELDSKNTIISLRTSFLEDKNYFSK